MDDTRDPRLFSYPRLTAVIFAAAAIFQIAVVTYFYLHFDTAIVRLMPDDAFYYLKIAQNISSGHGSVFSVGEPTNGYHPLWMAWLVLLHLVTHPAPDQFVVSALLSAVVLNLCAARAFGRLLAAFGFSETAVALAIVCYLFSPWLVNLTLTGMETPLFLWLLFVFLRRAYPLLYSGEPSTRLGALNIGAIAGLLMLARTDAILFTAPIFAAILWHRRRSEMGHVWVAVGVASLVVSPWLIWNLVSFGTIVQSSATAMPALFRFTLPPTLSADYWYALWRIFTWITYWAILMPLVPHDGMHQSTDWWGIIVLVLLGVLAGAIFDRRFVQHRFRAPWILFAPAAILLVYYCSARSFVQVWSISTLFIAAVVVAVNFVPLRWTPLRSVSLMLALVPLTGYSLSNCYFDFQSGTRIAELREYRASSGTPVRICATDAGLLGYFSRHMVINLDGVVNNRALEYIKAGRLSEYTAAARCDEVRVPPERVMFYDRNMAKPCEAAFGTGWFAREASDQGWWAWSEGSSEITVRAAGDGDWLLHGELMSAVQPNSVEILLNGARINIVRVDWGGFRGISPVLLPLSPGQNRITMVSRNRPTLVGSDTRMLTVALRNARLTRVTDDAQCETIAP